MENADQYVKEMIGNRNRKNTYKYGSKNNPNLIGHSSLKDVHDEEWARIMWRDLHEAWWHYMRATRDENPQERKEWYQIYKQLIEDFDAAGFGESDFDTHPRF